MEINGAYGRAPVDGKEHQLQFGGAHAFWIRANARNRELEQDPIAVSIRWVSAKIRETDSFALIAPQGGYRPDWHGTIDCSRREPTPRYFAIRTDGNFFGALSIDMQALCFGIDEVSFSYRLSKKTGVRALASDEELKLAD